MTFTMSFHSQNNKESIYFTTPLFYVNAKPHLGHAYAAILSDVLARHSRQAGKRVFCLTGTDEHGEKIAQKAKSEGLAPRVFADQISKLFENAWEHLGLSHDIFYRTSTPSHYKMVSRALQRLKDKGEIYFGSYEGKYCIGCERFRTDQEWSPEGLCPDHQTPPDIRKESNYFFRMSAYQERLLDFYHKNPDAIQPSQYLKETLSFLEQPLEDFSISRPVERLTWGVPLPFDPKYVTYVWFDALLSYPGGLGYDGEEFGQSAIQKDLWVSTHHLIGKDILKTHAIYWPTMLMALDMPLFKRLQVSGFWLTGGLKMSKTLGNVVEPIHTSEYYGRDAFRYFLLREMSYGTDANFSWEGILGRTNSELANGLGNLASRVLTLAVKNFNSCVPPKSSRTEQDREFLKRVHQSVDSYLKNFETYRYHMALAEFSETVALCDRYINDQKPWALAKDLSQKPRLEAVLGTAMDALWTLSILGSSVLVEGSSKLRQSLKFGVSDLVDPPFSLATELLKEGSALGEVPRLYPRILSETQDSTQK
jgi:methionyl-tRNA synthetase